MKPIIPLFSTSASLKNGGIFTVDKAGEAAKAGKTRGPVSLCDLVKAEGMKRIYLVEDRMVQYMQAFKNLTDAGCSLHFGLKLCICESMADKSEASFRTESKVIIWMARNTREVYERLIRISSKAATDGFYYIPRLDWKTLCEMWGDDLLLSLPFYSSFLARNTLRFSSIVPQLPAVPLVLREVDQQLPFDGLLNDAVDRYIETTNAEVQEVKSVYYRRRQDARAFMVWRCILNRSTWDLPNLDHCHSREFCYEAWQELMAARRQEAEAVV